MYIQIPAAHIQYNKLLEYCDNLILEPKSKPKIWTDKRELTFENLAKNH